jgi:hypothetical protein
MIKIDVTKQNRDMSIGRFGDMWWLMNYVEYKNGILLCDVVLRGSERFVTALGNFLFPES